MLSYLRRAKSPFLIAYCKAAKAKAPAARTTKYFD